MRRITLNSVLFLLNSTLAFTQITGEFRGLVLDGAGAAVTTASLTLTSTESGNSRQAHTDTEGRFSFPLLPVGDYALQVAADGFRTAIVGTLVRAGEIATARLVLEVGQVTESVTVTDAVSPLDNGVAQVQMGMYGELLQELPVRREPNLLALTATGIFPAPPNNSFLGTGSFNSNGGRSRANNVTVDNITATDVVVTGTAGPLGTLQFTQIKEVKLITNNFSAEYGRNSNAQLVYITRSGTNHLHGELYDYLQNDRFNARSWFDRTGKRSIVRQNHFGYALGGPLYAPRLYDGRNRTFFFTTYEGQKTRGEGGVVIAQVPTPAMLAQVTDPTAKALLDQYKLPPASVIAPGFGQVQQSAENRVDAYQLSQRIDHRFGERDQLWARYSRYVQTAVSPGLVFIGTNLSGYGARAATSAHQATLAQTHLFSPALVNELRAAFGRSSPDFQLHSPFPHGPRIVFLDGMSAFGASEIFPQGRLQNTYQLSNNVAWTSGAHIIKFGGEVHRLHVNSYNDAVQKPLITFANWADFARGQPARYQQRFGSSVRGNRVWNHFLFAQDDWRLTRNVTLNLGLRLEIAGGVTEVNDLASNLDLDCREPIGIAGSGPLGCFSLGRPSFHTNYNWGPRLGLAWNPAGSRTTVIRAGYGIAYDFIFLGPVNNQRFLPPFIVTASVVNTASMAPDGPNSLSRLVAGTAQAQIETAATAGVINPGVRNFGNLNPVIDEALANPYSQHWNFGVQQQLAHGLVAKVTYVGTAGTHLLRTRPINLIGNPPPPAAGVADETARFAELRGAFVAATGTVSTYSNRLDGRFNDVSLLESSATSAFHSLQVEVDKQFANGYLLRAGYTVAKSIDDVSDPLNVFANDSALQQNPRDNRDNRALSQYDLPQRLFLVHQFELPWGKAIRNRPLRYIAHGWGFSGITSFRSGFPVSLEAGARRSISALTLTGLVNGPVRPNASAAFEFHPRPAGDSAAPEGLLNLDGVQAISTYADSLGLSQPLLGNYGSLGRNTHRLDGERNFDWTVFKNFRFTETMRLQVRCEMYNAFNNTSFYNVNRNVTNPAFAQYTAPGRPARFMQLAARLIW